MSRQGPHLVQAWQWLVVAIATTLLAAAWWQVPPQLDAALVLLAAALGLLVAIGDRTELSFRFGGETLAATSATVPLLVAALYLPPPVAGVVALLSYLLVELRPGQLLHAAFGAASSAIALVVASAAARELVGGAPAPEHALLAGGVAALAFELLYTGAGMLMLELRRPGAAREFLPDARPVIVFDVVLGIVGVIVVAPFAREPWTLVGVLVVFQLVAHAGLGTLNREQTARERATMLHRSFARYVPAAVVQRLIERDEEVELGGEAREVTVLFCDIRDFTSWAERHDPAVVLQDLNELLGALTQCVFETEGTLDKFTGDGLMAFWGAPIDQPDHADRAVAAAQAFVAAAERLDEQRLAAGGAPLRIGIGIHSGVAIVGNVGHADRHDYTAIGDTVNVAARLEAATRSLEAPIVLSHATHARLDAARAAAARHAGRIAVKGRRAELEVYTIAASTDSGAAAA